MRLPCLTKVLYLSLALSAAPVLGAQQSPRPYLTLSANSARNVRDSEHEKFMAEVVAGLKILPKSTAGLLVAAFAGRTFTPQFGSDLPCPIEPGGGCTPMLEGFSYSGVQFGAQVRRGIFALELSSGPGAFRVDERRNNSGRTRPATTVLSIHTRADLTFQFGPRVGMVVSSNWRHLPQYDGAPMNVNGFGIGLRLR